MKIAAVQFCSTGNTKTNAQMAVELIEKAAQNGAQLIVLPEAASQNFASGRLDEQAEDLEGEFATALKEAALRLGVVVVAGMFRPADTVLKAAESDEKEGKVIHRVFNTALVTGRSDKEKTVHLGYDKIHAYDAFNYRESDTVKPGAELVTFDMGELRVGVATCYDVRFPEQYRDLARAGAHVIVTPFSWADGPGKLEQWRTLSAARALDATAYVVAAGQSRPGGEENAGQESGPTGIGHSVIVSPLGQRLAEAGYEDDIIYAEVDPSTVEKVRKQLPVLETA